MRLVDEFGSYVLLQVTRSQHGRRRSGVNALISPKAAASGARAVGLIIEQNRLAQVPTCHGACVFTCMKGSNELASTEVQFKASRNVLVRHYVNMHEVGVVCQLACFLQAEPGLVHPVLGEDRWGEQGASEGPDAEQKPGRLEDGGGITSSADWLGAGAGQAQSWLQKLKAAFAPMVDKWGLEQRLAVGFIKDGPGMFSSKEVNQIRLIGVEFLGSLGFQVSADIAPGQPFALDILEALLVLCNDGDSALPGTLRQGVPTGVDVAIEPCSVYAPEDRECKLQVCEDDIRICMENWRSAEDNVERVAELLEAEINQGWVERWKGSLLDAHKVWGDRVAVGKLALISVPGKDDRLVGDSSAPGVSGRARFPNRMKHPRPADVEEALVRCAEEGGDWMAITVDVKAAHKTMKVSEEDAGLCFFQLTGTLFRYLTCHFGASYSAFWWGRVSGALIRLLHIFLGTGHVAMTYVDDTLVLVRAHAAKFSGCLIAMFMTMMGVPLSWHKFRMGARVCFIGLVVGLGDFSLGLEADKVAKLVAFLKSLKVGNRLDRRALLKGTGVLMWASAITPWLRPRLAEFYSLANRPGLVWQSLTVSLMAQVFKALDHGGKLRWQVPGVNFGQGMCLGYVGKHKVSARESWVGWVPREPGCVGFLDWDSRRVRVNARAVEAAGLWQEVLSGGEIIRRCVRRLWAGGTAAADAMAVGHKASLGGWWMVSGKEDWTTAHWFRLEIAPADLAPWIQIRGDWGHDIVFFEALAQIILLVLRSEGGTVKGARLHQWCDNETTVMATRKGMSTAEPLCWALQAWEHWKQDRDVQVRFLKYLLVERTFLLCRVNRWRWSTYQAN